MVDFFEEYERQNPRKEVTKNLDDEIAKGGVESEKEVYEKPLTREEIVEISRKEVDDYYKNKLQGVNENGATRISEFDDE